MISLSSSHYSSLPAAAAAAVIHRDTTRWLHSHLPPPPPYKNRRCRRRRRICCESTPTPAAVDAAVSHSSDDNRKGFGGNDDDAKEEAVVRVLSVVRSQFNDIMILETNLWNRYLLLDSTHNVHSIYKKEGGPKWTDSYWDEFASLPAIVPKGLIAILGLGGGTAAHLMLDLWPSLELEGWDIDEILIEKSREFLGLSDLEKHTPAGGILHVRIGDALSPSVHTPGGYAGIVVDLFADGKVLPQLTEVETWLTLKDKLMPNGRLMVNCGAADNEVSDTFSEWEYNLSITAMCQAFSEQLINWKKMPEEKGKNYLALSGPLPDLDAWSAAVPDQLSLSVEQWRPCFLK